MDAYRKRWGLDRQQDDPSGFNQLVGAKSIMPTNPKVGSPPGGWLSG